MTDKKKENVKRIPSDQPTALIAPSDYEHIFKGDDEEPEQSKSKKQPTSVKQTPSPAGKPKSKDAKVTRVPSDQPTALIAPSGIFVFL